MGQLLRIDFGTGKLVPADDVTNRPAAADGTKYVPRYCDPANETRGATALAESLASVLPLPE